MRVLSTLYVRDHQARVTLSKGSLLVAVNSSKTRVPLEGLEAVVLLGSGQISSDALAQCVERRIRVTSLRRSGHVRFTVGGPTSGNVYLRLGQFAAASDPERTAALARWFVAGKLQNFRRLLQRWAWDTPEPERTVLRAQQDIIELRLQALSGVADGDKIRGIEGDSTRRYFKGLAARLAAERQPLHFMGRNRRPPRDPVNALLGFLYGLLLSEITGALESVGLDPQIGFLHGVRPGRPALALDVLEEVRPTGDRFAMAVIGRRRIRLEHFVTTPGGACYLSDDGRREVLGAYEAFKDEGVPQALLGRETPRWSLPGIQATLLARHLRGDLPVYPPYVMEN